VVAVLVLAFSAMAPLAGQQEGHLVIGQSKKAVLSQRWPHDAP